MLSQETTFLLLKNLVAFKDGTVLRSAAGTRKAPSKSEWIALKKAFFWLLALTHIPLPHSRGG